MFLEKDKTRGKDSFLKSLSEYSWGVGLFFCLSVCLLIHQGPVHVLTLSYNVLYLINKGMG